MSTITETAALAALCKRMAASDYITVDTEFIRDKTYWPKLCLVQVASADEACAIDTLAAGIDLAPLFKLLVKPEILKVFHAARQDVEIFLYLTGRVPEPMFDTQVAAMVCGFGDSVGYEKLVAKLARARIDKTMRYTDWSRRPLSAKQIDYALADVTHLRVVYEKLARQLERSKRTDWVSEEMAVLTAPETYRTEPGESWRRIKTRIRKRRHLGILRELAAWRETEAQTRDVPRNRVARDDTLAEIASHEPATREELFALRSMSRDQMSKKNSAAILEVVARARAMPESDYPEAPANPDERAVLGPSIDLLKVLLKMKCEQHDVAQKLVATTDDIEAIARDSGADVPALHGWRRELYGEDALALKNGALALTADGPRLKLIRTSA